MIRSRFTILLGLLALLYAAPAAVAQTHAQPELRLVLKGYDPVAYFTAGRPTPGKPEYETVFDEGRYRFSSAGNMSLFRGNPEKYAPQFSGACTNGLAQGVKVYACKPCWELRGLKEDELLEGIELKGMDLFAQLLATHTPVTF